MDRFSTNQFLGCTFGWYQVTWTALVWTLTFNPYKYIWFLFCPYQIKISFKIWPRWGVVWVSNSPLIFFICLLKLANQITIKKNCWRIIGFPKYCGRGIKMTFLNLYQSAWDNVHAYQYKTYSWDGWTTAIL